VKINLGFAPGLVAAFASPITVMPFVIK